MTERMGAVEQSWWPVQDMLRDMKDDHLQRLLDLLVTELTTRFGGDDTEAFMTNLGMNIITFGHDPEVQEFFRRRAEGRIAEELDTG